jgi:hypothetical protein
MIDAAQRAVDDYIYNLTMGYLTRADPEEIEAAILTMSPAKVAAASAAKETLGLPE